MMQSLLTFLILSDYKTANLSKCIACNTSSKLRKDHKINPDLVKGNYSKGLLQEGWRIYCNRENCRKRKNIVTIKTAGISRLD